VKIINILKDISLTRDQVKKRIKDSQIGTKNENFAVDQALDRAINFAARTWLLMDISQWKGQQSLQEFVADNILLQSEQIDKRVLGKAFNMNSLDERGIKVYWTWNIAEHLSMRRDRTKVATFHHAAILKLHKESNSK